MHTDEILRVIDQILVTSIDKCYSQDTLDHNRRWYRWQREGSDRDVRREYPTDWNKKNEYQLATIPEDVCPRLRPQSRQATQCGGNLHCERRSQSKWCSLEDQETLHAVIVEGTSKEIFSQLRLHLRCHKREQRTRIDREDEETLEITVGVSVDSTEETEIDDWLIWFNEEKVQSKVSTEIPRDLEKQKNESVIWSFEEKKKHRQTPRVKVFRCFSQLTNENEEIQISLSLKSFVLVHLTCSTVDQQSKKIEEIDSLPAFVFIFTVESIVVNVSWRTKEKHHHQKNQRGENGTKCIINRNSKVTNWHFSFSRCSLLRILSSWSHRGWTNEISMTKPWRSNGRRWRRRSFWWNVD